MKTDSYFKQAPHFQIARSMVESSTSSMTVDDRGSLCKEVSLRIPISAFDSEEVGRRTVINVYKEAFEEAFPMIALKTNMSDENSERLTRKASALLEQIMSEIFFGKGSLSVFKKHLKEVNFSTGCIEKEIHKHITMIKIGYLDVPLNYRSGPSFTIFATIQHLELNHAGKTSNVLAECRMLHYFS
jgi:hypothetical protein